MYLSGKGFSETDKGYGFKFAFFNLPILKSYLMWINSAYHDLGGSDYCREIETLVRWVRLLQFRLMKRQAIHSMQ